MNICKFRQYFRKDSLPKPHSLPKTDMKPLFLLIFLFHVSFFTSGQKIYFDINNSQNGNGTINSPYNNINSVVAASNALANDSIILFPGRYNLVHVNLIGSIRIFSKAYLDDSTNLNSNTIITTNSQGGMFRTRMDSVTGNSKKIFIAGFQVRSIRPHPFAGNTDSLTGYFLKALNSDVTLKNIVFDSCHSELGTYFVEIQNGTTIFKNIISNTTNTSFDYRAFNIKSTHFYAENFQLLAQPFGTWPSASSISLIRGEGSPKGRTLIKNSVFKDRVFLHGGHQYYENTIFFDHIDMDWISNSYVDTIVFNHCNINKFNTPGGSIYLQNSILSSFLSPYNSSNQWNNHFRGAISSILPNSHVFNLGSLIQRNIIRSDIFPASYNSILSCFDARFKATDSLIILPRFNHPDSLNVILGPPVFQTGTGSGSTILQWGPSFFTLDTGTGMSVHSSYTPLNDLYYNNRLIGCRNDIGAIQFNDSCSQQLPILCGDYYVGGLPSVRTFPTIADFFRAFNSVGPSCDVILHVLVDSIVEESINVIFKPNANHYSLKIKSSTPAFITHNLSSQQTLFKFSGPTRSIYFENIHFYRVLSGSSYFIEFSSLVADTVSIKKCSFQGDINSNSINNFSNTSIYSNSTSTLLNNLILSNLRFNNVNFGAYFVSGEVANLYVDSSAFNNFRGFGLRFNSISNGKILRSAFNSTANVPSTHYAIVLQNASTNINRNLEFFEIGLCSFKMRRGSNIYVYNGSNNFIEDSLVIHNNLFVIDSIGTNAGNAIYIREGQGKVRIFSNTIFSKKLSGTHVAITNLGNANFKIINNVFIGFTRSLQSNTNLSSNISFKSNFFQNPSLVQIDIGSGSMNWSVFSSAYPGNFSAVGLFGHAGIPKDVSCFNNGMTLTNYFTDINGVVRLPGTFDIGCYEYIPDCPAFVGHTIVNNTCHGGGTGTIDVSITGGNGGHTYLWSNGATTQDLTGLSAGTYTLTVTDNQNCTATASYTITQPDSLYASSVVSSFLGSTNVSCNGASDGSIDVSVSGGTSPYTYLWSTGAATQDLSALGAGSYSVVITDANGCQITRNFTLTQPTALQTTVTSTDVTCNGNADGALTITPNGGTAPYLIQFVGDSTASTQSMVTFRINMDSSLVGSNVYIIIKNGGTHQLTKQPSTNIYWGTFSLIEGDTVYYRYANGSLAETVPTQCGLNSGGTVIERWLQVPTSDTILPVVCFESCTNCDGSIPQGTSGYLTDTMTVLNQLYVGSISITITDLNGCSLNLSDTINQPNQFIASTLVQIDPTCPQNPDGMLSINVFGGTTPYSLLWNNGSTNDTLANIPVGNYWVNVQDAKGCSDSLYFTLTAPEPFDFEEICVLSVDSATGKNLVVWNKTPGQRTLEYRILKENAQGQFVQIGNQPYLNLSVFTDQSSNPQTQPDRYKIALLDSCGNSSDTSDFHRTIHLQSNLGSSGEVNLSWTPYIGKPVQSYEIWRWITSGNLVQIATVAASVNSYTDLNPPVASNVYYVVNAVFPSSCSPIAGKNTAFDISKSNILNQTGIGFNENQALRNMRVYPNPNDGVFTVEFSKIDDIQSVSIIDGVGRVIRHIKTVDNTKILLDLRNEPKGVYRINATYSNGQANVPIVVH